MNITETTTPQQVFEYASEHGVYPEGESIIATDPMWGYLYAKYVTKSRFIQFEQYSKKHHSGKYQPFAGLYCALFNVPKSTLGIY